MSSQALQSVADYTRFIADLVEKADIDRSTISVWSASPYTGVAEGEIYFKSGHRLRMREELDFDDALITAYGYEVYFGNEKLFWYDSFPHPNDPTLASTHPHHKHIPPNIKRHRIPAPGLRFELPNLPFIIDEMLALT